jgi:hypothetical protein
MSLLEVADVTRANFSIVAARSKTTPTFAFAGNADMDALLPLELFLRQLEQATAEERVSRITCDFRDLYFMNSSCFKCFVSWINNIASSKSELQYVVDFVTNPGMRWQARSLENLQHFGPTIVRITAQT